ncbi:MAG TPA: hypothetical protein VHA09_00420 [Nitrososphaera sp.]|nr:hypothetical protein [Nitrososphaera sp.]
MPKVQPSLFILCETCRWCATYTDKSRAGDKCSLCSGAVLSSFPIMPDEAFTFSYDKKRGVEMDFFKRQN